MISVVISVLVMIITVPVVLSRNPYTKSLFYGLFSVAMDKVHASYRKFATFHALGRRLFDTKQSELVPISDNSESVSDRCHRVNGLNPGTHTLQGTNTYLIGKGPNKILVDTGEDITAASYVKFLLNVVFPLTNTESITHIILTHGHGDHQGGVILLLKTFQQRKMPIPKVYKYNKPNGDFPARGFPCENIVDGQIFKAEDATLKAIFTPGHTDDHIAFILEEDKALLSGDCVLGCGTTVFDNLYDYMNSLNKLKKLMVNDTASKITRIYPGHGPIINNALEKIDEYITHRLQREQQIIDVLEAKNLWISSWELVEVVYGPLVFFIKVSAHWNLKHHLDKLLKEDRVEYKYPETWRIKSNNQSKPSNSIPGAFGFKEGHTMVCDGETCRWVPKDS